jgi:protein Mpv17
MFYNQLRTLTRKSVPAVLRSFSADAKSSAIANGQSLWAKYNHHLVVNPLITKGVTAGVIAFIADVICQTVFPADEKSKNLPVLDRIDWKRSFNFTLLNAFLMSTCSHYWYDFLSTKIVGDTMIASAKRVMFDQLLFAPTVISALFTGNMLMQGEKDWNAIAEKLKNDLPGTLMYNYSVWVPAQLINFRYVPPPLRVLWANFVGFFWNIYLSSATNKPSELIKQD